MTRSKLVAFFAVAVGGGICTPDFKSTDVLYIGDSISTDVLPYSSSLASQIRSEGDGKVVRYAVAGSSSANWLKGFNQPFFKNTDTLCDTRAGLLNKMRDASGFANFHELLKQRSPKAVVLALGTNDIHNYCDAINASHGKVTALAKWWLQRASDMAAVAAQSSHNCVWILPLQYTSGVIFDSCQILGGGYKQAFASFQNAVAPSCKIIDSSAECPIDLSFDKRGVHPTSAGAKPLGDCIGKAVNKALNSPSNIHNSTQIALPSGGSR